MAILEAKAVIIGEDRTGAAFASIEARVARLNRSMGAIGRAGVQAAAMGRYYDAGGGAALGRARVMVATAESERRIARREKDEARKMRRETLAHAGEMGGGLVMGHGAHQLAMMGGAMVIGMAAHEAAKAAAGRVHERVRMGASGMSGGETREAELEAAKLSASFPSVGQTEIMHMLRNARSIVGSYREAAEIMEPLAKLRIVAQGARPGADVSEDFDQLVKGLEIKGVTQDPKKFKEYMEGIAKGLNVFGDTLKPYQYYEMFKYGRQATPGLSEKFILGTAPTIAQELGGSSYGNAVSGFNRSVVGGRMEHAALKEMARLGLVAHDDIDWLKTGEAKAIKPGRGVQGWQLAQSDPNEWVKQYLLPALHGQGITDPGAVMKEIGILFSNRMAAQLVSLLATQQTRIDKDLGLLGHAKGLGAADDYASKDPTIAWGGLKASIEGSAGTIGAGIAAALTPSMNDLAKAIAGYTARLTEAQKDRQEGGTPAGQRALQRVFNYLKNGVDFDGANSDISPLAQLDADYAKRHRQLIGQRDALDPDGRRKWLAGGAGSLARLEDPEIGNARDSFEAQQLRRWREEMLYPNRLGAEKQLREIEQAHAARREAERKLAEFRAGVKRTMMFAGGPHGADGGTLAAAPSETPLGAAYFPTTRAMSYGGVDRRSGAPAGPYGPVQPPAASRLAGTSDLAALLASGRIEAKVTPDQITAKVEGQVQGSVSIRVEASADLKATIASAKGGSDKQFNLKVGTGAPDTGTAGRKP